MTKIPKTKRRKYGMNETKTEKFKFNLQISSDIRLKCKFEKIIKHFYALLLLVLSDIKTRET